LNKEEILLVIENSFTAAKDFADKNSLESFYEMMGRYDYLNRVARNESFITNEEYESNVKRASDLKLEFNFQEYKLNCCSFKEHLERCSEQVSKWPSWKQNLLKK